MVTPMVDHITECLARIDGYFSSIHKKYKTCFYIRIEAKEDTCTCKHNS